jgi:hypothetical protein
LNRLRELRFRAGGLFGTGKETYLGIRFIIKEKRAAQGRRSGKHCGRHKKTSNISGNAGAHNSDEKVPEAFTIFAFYSPRKILLLPARIVKGEKTSRKLAGIGADQTSDCKTPTNFIVD